MRRAREIWINTVGHFKKSGLTQDAYARQRGIPVGTLRAWIYRLRRADEDDAQILPVRVIASTAPTARQWGDEAGGIEVELGEPLRLRFSAGTPAAVVAEVVGRLRSRC